MANMAVIPKLSTCRGLKYVLFEGVSAGRPVCSPNDYKRVQLADSILENCLDSLKRILF